MIPDFGKPGKEPRKSLRTLTLDARPSRSARTRMGCLGHRSRRMPSPDLLTSLPRLGISFPCFPTTSRAWELASQASQGSLPCVGIDFPGIPKIPYQFSAGSGRVPRRGRPSPRAGQPRPMPSERRLEFFMIWDLVEFSACRTIEVRVDHRHKSMISSIGE